jgi:type 1 glutamine amidotransferase
MRGGLTVVAVLLCATWVIAQQNQPPQGAGGGQAAGQATGGQGPAAAAGQGRAGRGARTKKVVLAWADTRNGVAQHDSITHALSQLERIGYESGTYDLYIRTDSNIVSFNPKKTDGTPASGGPSLNNVDAILFAGHRNVPLDAAGQADLITAIKDQGKGFVALFIGLTPWDTFPEMANILGAKYVGHSPFGNQPSTLINESPDFPATKHIPQVWTTPDPYYQPTDYSRDKMQVLLRLDVSKYAPVPGYTRTDGDYPVAWAKMYGKGRVFYSSIGNGETAQWDNNNLLRMYFEAIKWSLGLTPYEIKPHPLPADARPPQGVPIASPTPPTGRGRAGIPRG